MHFVRRSARTARGITLIGLLFWAIVVAFVALIIVRVLPTVNEYSTILRAVQQIAKTAPSTVAEARSAFEKQKEIEYSISSIGGKDLQISKENDKVVIRFAYDKEVEIFEPVFLLIKYRGEGRSN
jgi:type II secretory pathway pseudopilin PulG